MWRKYSYRVVCLLPALALASCASNSYFVTTAKDEPWRRDAEISCLRAGAVQESAFIAGRSSLGGPDSACGAVHPFEVSALGNGLVGLKPSALVQCGMVPALDAWTDNVVIPAAHAVYGLGVAQMRVLSSYSCRPMNNIPGADLSEHGHANAVDIGAFTLTNGYTVSVVSGWNGSAADRRFLRMVHDGACRSFSTVLGPEANSYHRDHFHLDLMPRHVGKSICE